MICLDDRSRHYRLINNILVLLSAEEVQDGDKVWGFMALSAYLLFAAAHCLNLHTTTLLYSCSNARRGDDRWRSLPLSKIVLEFAQRGPVVSLDLDL